MRGIDEQIASLGQVGFIARSLHLFLAKLIYFLDSCLEFLLDRQSDFERERSHAFHQKLTHSVIDLVSNNPLAYRYDMFNAVALADVLGHEALLACVISNRHPASASSTDHQPLQQCWAFARRALAAVGSDVLRIFHGDVGGSPHTAPRRCSQHEHS